MTSLRYLLNGFWLLRGLGRPCFGWVEGTGKTEFWKELRPDQGYRDGADPAADHRRDRAAQRGEEAGFRLPQFVGGGNGEMRQAGHAAAHLVRRVKLDQRLPDIDRPNVGSSQQDRRHDRKSVVRGQNMTVSRDLGGC